MKKNYIIFSVIWLLVFSFIAFFRTKSKNIEINDINSFSHSIESDISLEIRSVIFKKNYIGNLKYLEPDNISLTLNFKKEFIDLGSNKKHFWYYSTYENTLNYGLTKDVSHIIKEVFNPNIIIKTLFVKPSKENGLQNDHLIGNYGVVLNREILIKDGKIVSHVVTDLKGEMIFTVQVLDYYKNIPSKLLIKYFKENYSVSIEMRNIKLNKTLGLIFFDVPLKKYEKSQFLTP